MKFAQVLETHNTWRGTKFKFIQSNYEPDQEAGCKPYKCWRGTKFKFIRSNYEPDKAKRLAVNHTSVGAAPSRNGQCLEFLRESWKCTRQLNLGIKSCTNLKVAKKCCNTFLRESWGIKSCTKLISSKKGLQHEDFPGGHPS